MLELLPARVRVTETADGLVLESPAPLPAPARCIHDWLVRWAGERSDATFLAERRDGVWARTTYAAALEAVEGIAAYLVAHGATPTRPVLILSDNSVASALVLVDVVPHDSVDRSV